MLASCVRRISGSVVDTTGLTATIPLTLDDNI